MLCSQENSIENKRFEKRTIYRQFTFEIKKTVCRFKVKVVPLVISAFGGGAICLKKMICVTRNAEISYMNNDSVIQKVRQGLVQSY